MSASIAGFLIIMAFFSIVLTTFRTTLFGNVVTSDAMKQATQLSGERARTAISIVATTGENSTGTLQVEVRNTGTTPIVDFSDMDVVVQYPGGNNAPLHLTFKKMGAPGAGEWTGDLTSASDLFESGIFNPDETMIIKAKLPATGDDTGTVTVATHNGVTDNACFDMVKPCPKAASSTSTSSVSTGDIGARVRHTGDQSIPNNTATVLAFNTEDYDTDSIHDTATNNSRLTAKTTGKYFIIAHAEWQTDSGGHRELGLKHTSGVTSKIIALSAQVPRSGPHKLAMNVTTLYELTTGDYVEVEAFQSSTTGPLSIISTGDSSPVFAMQKVG